MTTLWMAQGPNGKTLAQDLLAHALGVETLPPMARHPQGKPYFIDYPVAYNLSHSGPYALCGLANAPVGVDIEVVRPRSAGLPLRVLSPWEYQWYQDRGGSWGDFCTLWTLKEAQVKCQGVGLRRDPRTIQVPLIAPGESAQWEGLWYTAYAGADWRAALCGQNRQTPEIQWLDLL